MKRGGRLYDNTGADCYYFDCWVRHSFDPIPTFCNFQRKKTPKALDYLGFALPCSVFGMLLVYCLKDTVVTSFPFALPEVLGLAVTSAIYLWKKNTLISIAAGTVFYMFLIQVVF